MIRRSRPSQKIMPAAIRRMQVTQLAISEVSTAVFISPYFFAPKSCAVRTDAPMLQPKAKAMKISVIS